VSKFPGERIPSFGGGIPPRTMPGIITVRNNKKSYKPNKYL